MKRLTLILLILYSSTIYAQDIPLPRIGIETANLLDLFEGEILAFEFDTFFTESSNR